jgi:hypothetical protein
MKLSKLLRVAVFSLPLALPGIALAQSNPQQGTDTQQMGRTGSSDTGKMNEPNPSDTSKSNPEMDKANPEKTNPDVNKNEPEKTKPHGGSQQY